MTPLAVAAVLVIVVLGWWAWDALHPPADYGWSSSDRREHRIVSVVAEHRSQPTMGSRADLRDYLRAHGAGCRDYEEGEPSPEDIFSLGGHSFARCTGIDDYFLMVFSNGGDKRTRVDSFAGCKAVAPYKPAYWLEGPNWTVSIESDVSANDSTTLSSARRTAGALGARLNRSCAPSARYPGTPIRTALRGEMFTMSEQQGFLSGSKADVVIESITDPVVAADGTPAAPGNRLIDVTYLYTNRELASTSWLWFGLHSADSESYFEARSDTLAPDDTTPELEPGKTQRATLIFEVPATLTQPTLRVSPADDSAVPADLVDVILHD